MMRCREIQLRSSGPYPSQSARYWNPRPRWRTFSNRRTVHWGCPSTSWHNNINTEGPPDLGGELRPSVRNDVTQESVETVDVLGQEFCHLRRGRELRERHQVHPLREPVHHSEDDFVLRDPGRKVSVNSNLPRN